MKQLAPYSIWTQMYEKELDKKYGIELKTLRNGKDSGIEEIAEGEIPIFVLNPLEKRRPKWSVEEVKNALKKYENIQGYNSMLLKNVEELRNHTKNIYKHLYLHYVLGKKTNMKKEFPFWCCGYSSTNLQLSLFERGYPNITDFSAKADHCYLGFPFILEDSQERGFIIADPTSDQLWKRKGVIPPRNTLFVIKGKRWEYITDWKNCSDLYPYRFANLKTIKKNLREAIEKKWKRFCPDHNVREMQEYFKEVFENPVRLEINQ